MDEETQTQDALPEVISPEDELDLSGAGFQVPQTNWRIDSVKVEHMEGTTKQRAVIELSTEHEGVTQKVTLREWLRHPTVKAQQIGQGNLKRLLNAALGSPVGSLAALEGKYISAEGSEDDAGFRRLRSIREPEMAATDAGSFERRER